MINCEKTDSFYYVDKIGTDGYTYRIFSYRLAQFSNWLLPDALESRGIMYRNEHDEWILVCRPFEKFFNVNENPLSSNFNMDDLDYVTEKLDGSLIMSYLDFNGNLNLKTKASLESDQAKKAFSFLNSNKELFDLVYEYTQNRNTVLFEWVSPDNRIVINYPESKLTILAIRNNESGSYINIFDDDRLKNFVVKKVELNGVDPYEMQGIEGFVYYFKDSRKLKQKTKWYLTLHKTKDNVNTDSKLIEAILMEQVDDLKSLFHDDAETLQRIESMEEFIVKKYNRIVKDLNDFMEENSNLSRKDFMLNAQKRFDKFMFGLVVRKYLLDGDEIIKYNMIKVANELAIEYRNLNFINNAKV